MIFNKKSTQSFNTSISFISNPKKSSREPRISSEIIYTSLKLSIIGNKLGAKMLPIACILRKTLPSSIP